MIGFVAKNDGFNAEGAVMANDYRNGNEFAYYGLYPSNSKFNNL
jgi:hypothetical protein